jgi:hypothetical protein
MMASRGFFRSAIRYGERGFAVRSPPDEDDPPDEVEPPELEPPPVVLLRGVPEPLDSPPDGRV